MAKVTKIHPSKQPRRPHFIQEWMERRNLTQAEMARELGADPGLVSRWLSGASPGVEWQEKLAGLFSIDPEALFRSPEDDWMNRLFKENDKLAALLQNRDKDEMKRIINLLELTFPIKKDGTNG